MQGRNEAPTTGNGRLHVTGNDNWIRIGNIDTSKYLVVKSSIFPQRKIHKYSSTWQTENDNQVIFMPDLLEGLALVITTVWWLQDVERGHR